VSETGLALERSPAGTRAPSASLLVGLAVWGILLGNAVLILWLWWHGGNVVGVKTAGEALTSVARITGLFAAYLALVLVLLLGRLPWLDRLAGLDRLSFWHRVLGHATLYLVVAHVAFSVWGYALMDRFSIPKELSTMLGGGVYPGMITATVGTALWILVVASSVVVARRRLPYEAWYAVHLSAYAAIALAWFHQIPTGNELVLDRVAADYWRGLYVTTLALLVAFRIAVPVVNAFRFRLRVTEVVEEGPGVVSLRIGGRRLDRLHAQAGQFFLWRFLDRNRWWSAHPFSLSAAPGPDSLRLTVKALGDHSARVATIRPGTRVLVEGPFGRFTSDAGRRAKRLLIAGGIGITPVRALMEEIEGDTVVLYRVVSDDEVIFREELRGIADARGIDLRIVTGDHEGDEGARLLSPQHLRELVPDLMERDVYVCGPPGLIDAVVRNARAAGVHRRDLHAERFTL
jgi:predicted ferric reductase